MQDRTNENLNTGARVRSFSPQTNKKPKIFLSVKARLYILSFAMIVLFVVASLLIFSNPNHASGIQDVKVEGKNNTPAPTENVQTQVPITDNSNLATQPPAGGEDYYEDSEDTHSGGAIVTDEPVKVSILPIVTAEPTLEPLPFSEYLEYKDTHPSIAIIQTRYMALNYMDYDEPTEYFGPITRDATEMFQRRNNLEVTGKINEETYRLLMSSEARIYMVALGDKGDDVRELQSRLYEMGYMKASPTGYFGTDTHDAVLLFQTNNGLTVDGMIGERTREILYSSEAVPNVWMQGDSGDGLVPYQERLKALGYLTSEPDGVNGKETVAAVKRFQERNGLIADGYLGPKTMTLLMSEDAVPNSLAMGMRGEDVKCVQHLLKNLKYLNDDMVTGYFGAATNHAVRAFQKHNGLSADGRIGKQTMSVLTSDGAKSAPSSYEMYTGGSSNDSGNTGGGNTGGNDNPPPAADEPSVAALVAIAKSKVGSRYVRGGKGPNTFDCSGFVYWVLNQVGIKQSYLTSYGWRSVSHYPRINDIDDLKAGDVIVFYGHVGIIISDTEMIDASSGQGKVVRRGFLSNWCRSEFICGYRVLG
ncbi:MAG: peptidoglycan-binding protein [Clostridiales bacterium]|nr:peptidoglycan-binding protein [Clostridiales bacterium]